MNNEYNSTMCTKGLPQLDSEVALDTNKSQGMALSAGANITGLNHILQWLHDNTISTLQAGNPRESTQNGDLIVYTNYWYRTT